MPQTQDTDGTADTGEDFSPRPAATHVALAERTAAVTEERDTVWPHAPWRWILLSLAIFIAIACGPAAADPAANTADLFVFISLGLFVVAFIPGRNRS